MLIAKPAPAATIDELTHKGLIVETVIPQSNIAKSKCFPFPWERPEMEKDIGETDSEIEALFSLSNVNGLLK
jgi:hypothetical protein